MNGKIIGIFIVGVALIAGAVIYYLQEYAFYQKVVVTPGQPQIELTSRVTGQPVPIAVEDFRAIDSQSSPIRFRACFTVLKSPVPLTDSFEIYDDPVPLTGPRWFDCYDAGKIGTALENGDAIAFLSQKDIHDGVDRVVAVFPDGRAFAWHQLNGKYKE